MKLKAKIGNEISDIEIVRDGRSLHATVDGRPYEIDVSEPEPNVWLLKHENRVSEASVLRSTHGHTAVRIGNNEFDVTISDPKRLRGSNSHAPAGEGASEIKTAMPGKVVRILVEVGSVVATGDGVIVVEAMKMQNELKAHRDGVIKEIRPSEGDNVNAGDVLIVID